ncbi:MAG: VTC domain-containing protein [Hyphomicrobiales bacterium]|nr:VTC domain-containing protein [Hyphomicrobiales bacterium]
MAAPLATRLPENDHRIELKAVGAPIQEGALLAWLASHPARFHIHYPERTVYNLYYDSHQLHAFQDALAGNLQKMKYRLRWYNQGLTATQATLEYKARFGTSGKKISAPIRLPYPLHTHTHLQLRQHIYEQLPEGLQIYFLENSEPILLNTYRREYYISGDKQLRITIDRHLEIYDQRFTTGPSLTLPAMLPECTIVEYKYPVTYQDNARQILQSAPLKPSRFSKYSIGLQYINKYT